MQVISLPRRSSSLDVVVGKPIQNFVAHGTLRLWEPFSRLSVQHASPTLAPWLAYKTKSR
jgi:hypothetical protein